MKFFILMIVVFCTQSSSAADWLYATTATNGENYYIDKSFYKYDSKNQTVDVWDKSENKSAFSNEVYTTSKSLSRYSCSNKSSKILASINYNQDGSVKQSFNKPQKEFTLIFPDTIAETIWHISCDTKGKGFKFKKNEPRYLSESEINKVLPQLKSNGN